jgi:hypothetical protein
MRKLAIGLGLFLVFVLALFFWGLSGANPENAPQETRTIDVTPQP